MDFVETLINTDMHSVVLNSNRLDPASLTVCSPSLSLCFSRCRSFSFSLFSFSPSLSFTASPHSPRFSSPRSLVDSPNTCSLLDLSLSLHLSHSPADILSLIPLTPALFLTSLSLHLSHSLADIFIFSSSSSLSLSLSLNLIFCASVCACLSLVFVSPSPTNQLEILPNEDLCRVNQA